MLMSIAITGSYIVLTSIYPLFMQGIEKYEFKKLLDIHRLLQQRPQSEIKDPFIRRFKSFLSLKSYAESAHDAPLLGKIKVILQEHLLEYSWESTLGHKCVFL